MRKIKLFLKTQRKKTEDNVHKQMCTQRNKRATLDTGDEEKVERKKNPSRKYTVERLRASASIFKELEIIFSEMEVPFSLPPRFASLNATYLYIYTRYTYKTSNFRSIFVCVYSFFHIAMYARFGFVRYEQVSRYIGMYFMQCM